MTVGTAFDGSDHDVQVLWGPRPAAMIDAGVQRLIARLNNELGRYPKIEEIDGLIYGPGPAPEIIDGIVYATAMFRADVGRYPMPAEIIAGLLATDTDVALTAYIANEIRVGDRVMWAEQDNTGQFLHRARENSYDTLVIYYGTVTGQPQGWDGPNVIIRDDGRTVSIDRERLIRVGENV